MVAESVDAVMRNQPDGVWDWRSNGKLRAIMRDHVIKHVNAVMEGNLSRTKALMQQEVQRIAYQVAAILNELRRKFVVAQAKLARKFTEQETNAFWTDFRNVQVGSLPDPLKQELLRDFDDIHEWARKALHQVVSVDAGGNLTLEQIPDARQTRNGGRNTFSMGSIADAEFSTGE